MSERGQGSGEGLRERVRGVGLPLISRGCPIKPQVAEPSPVHQLLNEVQRPSHGAEQKNLVPCLVQSDQETIQEVHLAA